MKINKDIFLVATAKAMQNDSTKKLFKAEPVAFDMFSLFAFAVFNRLDGKDITEDSFHSTVVDVLVQASQEKISVISMIKQLALIIFSFQIWEELEKNWTNQTAIILTNQTAITRNMTVSKLN